MNQTEISDMAKREISQDHVRLDIGCGKRRKAGYLGVDKDPECNPHILFNFDQTTPLPIEDCCVEEIYTSHFLEHLEPVGYINTMNEFWRILKPEGIVNIIVPYFRTKVAVQDPGHQMQFCEDSFKYLDLDSSPYHHYTNDKLKCNFNVTDREIKGPDFEHLMLHVILVKKEMPKLIEEVTHSQEEFEELTNPRLGIPHKFLDLILKYPNLFNVAAECAQLREVHAQVAYNVLGEDGFIQELLNVQRKWVRLYGMCFESDEPKPEIHIAPWRLRKQLFDLINYAIAALETFDNSARSGLIPLITKVRVDTTVEEMVAQSIKDSGGYQEGTIINPKLLDS